MKGMSSSPHLNAQATVLNRRRYRRYSKSSCWEAMPLGVKVSIALCLVVLIAMPLGQRTGRFKKRDEAVLLRSAAVPPLEGAHPIGLELAESLYLANSHIIKGVIVNKSDTFYRDVVISYTTRDRRRVLLGVVVSTLDSVRPHEKAMFQTNSMPQEVATFELREIAGNPR